MTVTLILSNDSNSQHSRISEVGVTLRALLNAFSEYEEEIAQTKDAGRIAYLRIEQAKTGEVYQKLMDETGKAQGIRTM